ncbi:MAG: O-methyltransferase [Promethearchaeota archaeon]|nr:MAG: O-methyltransferase [Candidatus Lokiarchaeota archaeon]
MFHNIPDIVKKRMRFLENIDSRDRDDGTTRMQRLRQIPPETGKFLSLLAASAPRGEFIEIGTSAGYSSLWIALACQIHGIKLKTHEVLESKIKLAKETIKITEMEDIIELIEGDARKFIKNYDNIAFCFLDAEKEIYEECYDLVIPKMIKGGLLIADNAINHYETLKTMINKALTDSRVDAIVVPIGKGELLCRKNY